MQTTKASARLIRICVGLLLMLLAPTRMTVAQTGPVGLAAAPVSVGADETSGQPGPVADHTANAPRWTLLPSPRFLMSGTSNIWTLWIQLLPPTTPTTLTSGTWSITGNIAPGQQVTIPLGQMPTNGSWRYWSIQVNLDSTTFMPGSQVQFSITYGTTQSAPTTLWLTPIPVKNSALVYHEQTSPIPWNTRSFFSQADDQTQYVGELLRETNYHVVTIQDANPWTAAQIANALRYYNVLYEYSHGNTGFFESSYGQPGLDGTSDQPRGDLGSVDL